MRQSPPPARPYALSRPSDDAKLRLRSAFLQMNLGMPIERITVVELTRRAQASRTTFYQHYQDVYDLRAQIQREILVHVEGLRRHTAYIDFLHLRPDEPLPMYTEIYEYIYGERLAFRALLFGRFREPSFADDYLHAVLDSLMAKIKHDRIRMAQPELALDYVVGGLHHQCRAWLAQTPTPPPADIALWATRLVRQNLYPSSG